MNSLFYSDVMPHYWLISFSCFKEKRAVWPSRFKTSLQWAFHPLNMRPKHCLEIWCNSHPVTRCHISDGDLNCATLKAYNLQRALHILSSDKISLLLRAMVTVYYLWYKTTHIKEGKAEKRMHCHTLLILLYKIVRSDWQTAASYKRIHCSLGSKTKSPAWWITTVFGDENPQ